MVIEASQHQVSHVEEASASYHQSRPAFGLLHTTEDLGRGELAYATKHVDYGRGALASYPHQSAVVTRAIEAVPLHLCQFGLHS